MKVIYKYTLNIETKTTLPMPVRAKVLTAQLQDNLPCIWAVVDSKEEKTEERDFFIFPTGVFIEGIEYLKYISTLQIDELVFHVFEEAVW